MARRPWEAVVERLGLTALVVDRARSVAAFGDDSRGGGKAVAVGAGLGPGRQAGDGAWAGLNRNGLTGKGT